MTTIPHLIGKLQHIERRLFQHSIDPMPITEIMKLRQDALDLRDDFLNSSFIGAKTLEELEDMRFRIVEVELNAHIVASEATYQNTEEQMRRLTDLYASVS